MAERNPATSTRPRSAAKRLARHRARNREWGKTVVKKKADGNEKRPRVATRAAAGPFHVSANWYSNTEAAQVATVEIRTATSK
jgi:hypothetical protein